MVYFGGWLISYHGTGMLVNVKFAGVGMSFSVFNSFLSLAWVAAKCAQNWSNALVKDKLWCYFSGLCCYIAGFAPFKEKHHQ